MEEPKQDTNDSTEKTESFRKVMCDKLRDMMTTFPELKDNLDERLNILWKCDDHDESTVQKATQSLLEYCQGVFPSRFFDILYENEEIFTNDELDLHFLPGIDYKKLWKTNISDNTRSTIWKYLQLILFSSVSGVGSAEGFGDTAELFKAINEEDFKKKLEETMEGMQDMFKRAAESEGDDAEGINLDDLPNAEGIHDHVRGLMQGKLGALAAEIAEETAEELGMEDMNDAKSVNDVFAKLLKDPKKIMGMVKNVGSKLDEKIKSGDIKESELLAEASEMMKKMKEMPGMENIQGMLSKMGLGKQGGKVNHAAMQAHMERNIRIAQQKERLRQRAGQKTANVATPQYTPEEMAEMEARAEKARQELLAEFENDRGESVFRAGGGAQRSSARPSNASDGSSSSGKKSGKKKRKGKGKGKKKK